MSGDGHRSGVKIILRLGVRVTITHHSNFNTHDEVRLPLTQRLTGLKKLKCSQASEVACRVRVFKTQTFGLFS